MICSLKGVTLTNRLPLRIPTVNSSCLSVPRPGCTSTVRVESSDAFVIGIGSCALPRPAHAQSATALATMMDFMFVLISSSRDECFDAFEKLLAPFTGLRRKLDRLVRMDAERFDNVLHLPSALGPRELVHLGQHEQRRQLG